MVRPFLSPFLKRYLPVIVISLFGFTLFLKLGLLFQETQPIFSNQTITIFKNDKPLETVRWLRQQESLQFQFVNPQDSNITIGISTDIPYEVYARGEKVPVQVLDNHIQFKVPKVDWGMADVSIRRQVTYKPAINLLFYLVLFGILVFNRRINQVMVTTIGGIFLIAYLGLFIYQYRAVITEKIEVATLSRLYQQSQYVMGQGSPEVIADETIYLFAGWHDVANNDPVGVDFSHPPFGKYLYGLSLYYWGQPRLTSLILYLGSLTLFFGICQLVFQNRFQKTVALILFGTETVLLDLIKTTLLDLPLLLFLLLAYWGYLSALKSNRPIYFILISLSLGLAASSKMYITTVLFTVALVIDLWVSHRPYLIYFILSLPIAGGVFVASYQGLIVEKGISGFINFQRWLLSWYRGKTDAVWGIIFSTLLLGKSTAWWDLEKGKVISYQAWLLSWPVYLAATVLTGIRAIMQKQLPRLIIWPILYLSFLSLGAASPNLLVVLIPFFILLTVRGLSTGFSK